MTRSFAPLLLAAALSIVSPAHAQETVHLRGTIIGLDGDTARLETASGDVHDVRLAEDHTVFVYERIDIADVGAGDFLSIPSVTSGTGEKVALSINVFPEALRGTGEGERAWDLTEGSLMTNATVGEVLSASDGSVVMVRYGDTEEPVLVPEGTPVTRFGPDPERRLGTGDQTILFVQQGEDGTPVANLAGVGSDGSLPPV